MTWLGGSIVRRLVVATVSAALLTATAGITVIQVLERRQLVDEALAADLAVAQRTATRIDDRITAIRGQLELIASRPAVVALDSDAEAELAIVLRISTALDELVLYDRTGRPIAAAAASRLLRAEDLPVRDVAEPDAEHWSANDTPLPSLEITVPVEDPPGTTIGVLVGRVPIALVAREATAQLTGSPGSVFLTDGEGRIRAHPETGRVLDGERLDVAVFAADPTRTRTVDGTTTLMVASPLQLIPGWVVIEQPRSDVFRPAETTLSGFTVVFLGVVTSIVVAVLLAGRRLLRPLRPLADAVERVGQGDLDARVLPKGSGEVAVLGHGFNRMAGSIQERQARLEQAEREARESEERFRLMVEGVVDYAIFLVGPDGTIRSWNTGGSRLLGYEEDDALGCPLDRIVEKEGSSQDPLVVASEEGRAQTEGWCRRRDGTRFWARTAVTVLPDERQGPSYGYAVIIHDLTDRKGAEAALETALEREKLAAEELRRTSELKDEFLAIAAHEIRTPLSAILGAAQVLTGSDEGSSDEERRQFHAMIGTYAEDMRDIVERLLDFTRLQAGRVRFVPKRFELRQELERHLTLLDRHLVEHVVILEAADTEIHTDPELLRHVLTNLVSNAARFSPPGSVIRVAGHSHDGQLTVVVSDEGCGIPPEDHDRIFELFRQSSQREAASSGTGVGLAIVKRYVELVGGNIALESSPGNGATFTIRIPLTGDTEGAHA